MRHYVIIKANTIEDVHAKVLKYESELAGRDYHFVEGHNGHWIGVVRFSTELGDEVMASEPDVTVWPHIAENLTIHPNHHVGKVPDHVGIIPTDTHYQAGRKLFNALGFVPLKPVIF